MAEHPRTLGALRRTPAGAPDRVLRSVRDEIRANLITRLRDHTTIFPGVVGYDDSVVPQIVNALLARHHFILLGLRGQAKSRILRALASHVQLSARTRKEDWDDWKKLVGAPRARPAGRLQFDHLHFVLQAAVDGLGIALAPTSLVAHDLASGRLQSPLPSLRMTLNRYYYGLAPDAAPEAAYVAEWFEEMMGASRGAKLLAGP